MRFVPWCVALAVALAASPSAFAQKKAAKKPPAPKPVHMPAPKPVHMPAPKPAQMPAAQPKPRPAPAAKPAPAAQPKPKPAPAAKPSPSHAKKTVKPTPAAKPNANASAAQHRQAETARAEAMIRAGQLPRSARPSRPVKARVATAGRSATPSRLIPSSGNLITMSRTGLMSAPMIAMSKNGLMSAPRITMSKNGLMSAPLITQTPIPALTGLAKAPRITPTAAKTNSLMVQNFRKEVVVVPRYVGRGHGRRYSGYHRGYGYGYGRGYRSYARFRRPYRNPNAASQALFLQRLEQLRVDLDQVRQSRAVPSEALRARIGDDLLAIARSKPTAQEAAAIRQLGDDLGMALRGHPGPIPPTADLVLALNQVVNHRRMTPEAVNRSIQDGRMALQSWRVSLPRVTKLVQDLRAVGGAPSLASASIVP